MTPTERLIQESCCAAAADLGVAVITPFVLVGGDGRSHVFIALFEQFGNDRGVLVCHADDWLVNNPIAANHGYYCSGLHPDSYSRYDRRIWIDTFEEWGWRGREEGRPPWCRG